MTQSKKTNGSQRQGRTAKSSSLYGNDFGGPRDQHESHTGKSDKHLKNEKAGTFVSKSAQKPSLTKEKLSEKKNK